MKMERLTHNATVAEQQQQNSNEFDRMYDGNKLWTTQKTTILVYLRVSDNLLVENCELWPFYCNNIYSYRNINNF